VERAVRLLLPAHRGRQLPVRRRVGPRHPARRATL
jgi:hypothetical protein